MSSATGQRIFEAARAQFDQVGGAGLSMRKIAAEVGITPMAIYRHYADKDAVLDALMLDGMAAWEARARSIGAADSLEWLEQLMLAFRDFALEEPSRYEAAFLLPASRARRYPDDFVLGRSPVINLMYARIDEAKSRGALDQTPTAEIALSLSALAQGLVSMHRAGRFAGEPDFRASYAVIARRALDAFRI